MALNRRLVLLCGKSGGGQQQTETEIEMAMALAMETRYFLVLSCKWEGLSFERCRIIGTVVYCENGQTVAIVSRVSGYSHPPLHHHHYCKN